ncbi:MAG: XisI protein [Blastocatellia bacterium]
MDKLDLYRTYIQEILEEIAGYKAIPVEIETELVIDRTRDHYLLVNVGWRNLKRTYGNPIHLDIKDGKIWLQQDMTDYSIAEKLLEKGVPKEDIVLAFHAPYKRPYTGFAIG